MPYHLTSAGPWASNTLASAMGGCLRGETLPWSSKVWLAMSWGFHIWSMIEEKQLKAFLEILEWFGTPFFQSRVWLFWLWLVHYWPNAFPLTVNVGQPFWYFGTGFCQNEELVVLHIYLSALFQHLFCFYTYFSWCGDIAFQFWCHVCMM